MDRIKYRKRKRQELIKSNKIVLDFLEKEIKVFNRQDNTGTVRDKNGNLKLLK